VRSLCLDIVEDDQAEGMSKRTFRGSEVVMLAWVLVALPYVVARGGPFALVKGVP
jgi:hypothetical protein